MDVVPAIGSKDEPRSDERLVVGQCLFFGVANAYLDCLLVLPNGERYISISKVSLYRSDASATLSIIEDHRRSGETFYGAHFSYRIGSQSRVGGIDRGLPRTLTGDVSRGTPGKGGVTLMQDILFRIDHEFYWGKAALDRGSRAHFAFQDASRLWAVALGDPLDTEGPILSMRVTDRIKQEDSSLLGRGTLIAIEDPTKGSRTKFRFLDKIPASQVSPIGQKSYSIEIIEE